MNKLLLALIILGAGTLASTRLNLLANQSRTSTARSRSARSLLASQVNELAVVAAALRTQVEAKRTRLNEVSEAVASERGAASTFNSDSVWDRQRATPSQLRRRFGIVWTNSPDYVLVSKATLKGVNGFLCDGLDGDGALMPIACTVLSVTAAERNAIQAALMRAKADHAVWIKTAVQRVEPVGDILADYRIPANPKVAQRLQGEVSLVLTE
ncbi:MAG: hypothetical protein NT031_05070, partial [Planctomycetota bacterium]|nr:hypothetical protein [Planctomycetota bacterium]